MLKGINKMSKKNKVSDEEIKEIHNRILGGESVASVTKEYKISRNSYYERIKVLGLDTKKKIAAKTLKKDLSEFESISSNEELAAALDISTEDVIKLSNPQKGLETNRKRMSYLKNKSPEGLQEAFIQVVLNKYNLSIIDLIKLVKDNQSIDKE